MYNTNFSKWIFSWNKNHYNVKDIMIKFLIDKNDENWECSIEKKKNTNTDKEIEEKYILYIIILIIFIYFH